MRTNAETPVTQAEETPDADEAEEVLITLHSEAGLSEAEEFLQTCLDLPIDKQIIFDASDVEAISTPYILTLTSALNARAESSPKVVLKGAPQIVIDGFTDLGLFQSMMKMEFQ